MFPVPAQQQQQPAQQSATASPSVGPARSARPRAAGRGVAGALRSAGLLDDDESMRDVSQSDGESGRRRLGNGAGRRGGRPGRSASQGAMDANMASIADRLSPAAASSSKSPAASIRGAAREARSRSSPLSHKPARVPTGPAADKGGKRGAPGKAIDALRRFLSSRYNAEQKFLNLENMGDDEILKAEGFVPPGYPKFKSNAGPVMFKLASQMFPGITTISLASNRLRSLIPYSSIAQFLPDLQNLSLRDNDIRAWADLDPLSGVKGKLTKLKELIVIGNPVAEHGDTYRNEVLRRFPSLDLLDLQPVLSKPPPLLTTPKNPHAPPAPSARRTLPPPPPPVHYPLQMAGNFTATPEIATLASTFLVKFFTAFDTARATLGAAYAPTATFSIAANTGIPPRARKAGVHEKLPNQKSLKWAPYVQTPSKSRNLSRLKMLDDRANSLVSTPAAIVQALSSLPGTTHTLSEADKFVFEAWPMGGVLDSQGTVIFCAVHGEFNEKPSNGIRSFDRSFVFAPTPENSPAASAGWPCVILSDQLTIRGYSPATAWAPEALAPPAGPTAPQQAPPQQPQPLPGLTEAQHAAALQLSAATSLNYTYSVQCLEGNAWDMDKARANFEQIKESIPPEGFA